MKAAAEPRQTAGALTGACSILPILVLIMPSIVMLSPAASTRRCSQYRGTTSGARSKPGLGQQGRKRQPADVVYPGEGDAIAHDLGHQRRVELGAVEFPEHHGKVGALRIPRGLEVAAKLDLRIALRSAD